MASTVSNGALLDTPLMQDQLNARAVDPVFVAGQPAPAWRGARDRSGAPEIPWAEWTRSIGCLLNGS